MNKKMRLSNLIAEPLALDASYVPQLIGDIQAEQESRIDLSDKESPPLSTLIDCKGNELAADFETGDQRPGSLVAVVPLQGVVVRHSYWRAGTAEMSRHAEKLDLDPAIGSIILDVNSPGGSVYGTEEYADVIRSIRDRGQTYICAAVDPLMASAATWIATATSEVAAIPSADCGSIGVISIYADMSRLYKNMGVDVEVERVPEKKARFTGVEPMSESMRAEIKRRNTEAYERFLASMALNRGVTRESVIKNFGGGEVIRAREAVEVGLIDRIATLDQMIDERVKVANKPDDRVAKHRRRMQVRNALAS